MTTGQAEHKKIDTCKPSLIGEQQIYSQEQSRYGKHTVYKITHVVILIYQFAVLHQT